MNPCSSDCPFAHRSRPHLLLPAFTALLAAIQLSQPINPAGFTFHGAIHATLLDAHCGRHGPIMSTMAVCETR